MVILVGRDDFPRDELLLTGLIDLLRDEGWSVGHWFSRHEETRRLTMPPFVLSWPRPARALIIGPLLLLHPSRWQYFIPGNWARAASVAARADALLTTLQQVSHEEVFLVARSAGARVATLIADAAGVRGVIALGYPFENPEEGPNPDRYLHLATLESRLLILQGVNDEYGGRGAAEAYPLAAASRLEFLDTDHNMRMDQISWQKIRELMVDFLDG
ncbi:MAG: hypothetical protein BGO47_07770 [Microbacterium sp. 67-17]|uniref:alpha/beta family hydrolase n=1 Tax=Microbacterium sp. 67-17 TaxID=1895782 RepID=UPI000962C224|nr:alpha/beta family hydrolase [Microbacterium sp. 67-17]OJV98183.1 MAG: hypothetical protein BGO47_07770 [Microbacterium sp. 67-17]